jgi:two-component system copper resistance phosphate regulon response regulator CusR
MRLLLVEDDPVLRQTLAQGFGARGVELVAVGSVAEARERLLLGTYTVVVLDVMLPDGSGFDLCAELRGKGIETPVLMLTARDSVPDKVTGFNAGADDYLVKPFAFPELLARVSALSRRQPALVPSSVQVADLEVDLRSRSVTRSGRPIVLTAKEFGLLEFFVTHAGEVVDRAAITAHVWDENHDPFTNALEVLVRRLRAKIDDPFEPKLIRTVRGAGYQFGP